MSFRSIRNHVLVEICPMWHLGHIHTVTLFAIDVKSSSVWLSWVLSGGPSRTMEYRTWALGPDGPGPGHIQSITDAHPTPRTARVSLVPDVTTQMWSCFLFERIIRVSTTIHYGLTLSQTLCKAIHLFLNPFNLHNNLSRSMYQLGSSPI